MDIEKHNFLVTDSLGLHCIVDTSQNSVALSTENHHLHLK